MAPHWSYQAGPGKARSHKKNKFRHHGHAQHHNHGNQTAYDKGVRIRNKKIWKKSKHDSDQGPDSHNNCLNKLLRRVLYGSENQMDYKFEPTTYSDDSNTETYNSADDYSRFECKMPPEFQFNQISVAPPLQCNSSLEWSFYQLGNFVNQFLPAGSLSNGILYAGYTTSDFKLEISKIAQHHDNEDILMIDA